MDVLRVAAGDGRLTSDELDGRAGGRAVGVYGRRTGSSHSGLAARLGDVRRRRKVYGRIVVRPARRLFGRKP
ncbi:hypothetical protein [Streptomyces xinghaiensis]|uniref:hypothetical protein n=1 Tax=Streptomyces xinghaiensis TaxID=1038928 RepID=UPI003F4D5780